MVLSRTRFAALLIAGVLIRAAALPGPGTGDLTIWKVWSYNARHHAGEIYGVGGTPPERRELTYAGATAMVDYPPLAVYELGLAGDAYWRWSNRHFPNATPLNAFVKLPALAADVGLALLLFAAVRARLGITAAQLAFAAYWLNPAVVLNATILGYLDTMFVLPAAAALIAAASGWPALAGAMIAAAVLTKAQGVFIAPAVALAIWVCAAPGRRDANLLKAGIGAMVTAIAIVAPVIAAGGWPNMVQALGRLATHDMLSANAANLWWLIGWALRVRYSAHDMGLWPALTAPAKILTISRVVELGYPNPRAIGATLAFAAIAWAVWMVARRTSHAAPRTSHLAPRTSAALGTDVWLLAGVAAFSVHAYATLSAQVHENHLFAAVPLLVLAAAGRAAFRPIAVGVSAIVALNLNLLYGFGDGIGFALPRAITVIDVTIWLALANCFWLLWHARVLARECSTAAARRQIPAPA
jgi:hypothetical protein